MSGNDVFAAHAIREASETISYIDCLPTDPVPLLNRIGPGGTDLVASAGGYITYCSLDGGGMKLMKLNRKILLVVASFILLAALPVTSLSQGRGRGRGQEKKLDKFVNGHDARDGRWDGRGPRIGRRTVISNVIIRHRRADRFRNRDFDRDRFRNRVVVRRRGLDNEDFRRSQRLRQRHRHLDRRGW